MTLQIGDTAPDFQVHTARGPIRFHDRIGDSCAVLSSRENSKHIAKTASAITAPQLERVIGGGR
ncbi:MAG: hypothetical protein JO372_21165 [Solirubrobacterales bacterium]|nr:hypothetical protein [Solirubrobacterales bacterium]